MFNDTCVHCEILGKLLRAAKVMTLFSKSHWGLQIYSKFFLKSG
jgi:hypothetical protein